MVREGREARGWIRADRLSRDVRRAMWDKTRKSYSSSPSALFFVDRALLRSVLSEIDQQIIRASVCFARNESHRRAWNGREEIFLPLGSPPHYPTVTFSQLNREFYVRKKRRRNSRVATTKDFLLRREELKRVRLLRYSSKGTLLGDSFDDPTILRL